MDAETLAVGPESARALARETARASAEVEFREIFALSYPRLVVQLYGVTGDAAEAEDLVQEAFVRAYAAGSRFTRVDNPEAWLRTTAVNLYRNRWRKMRNFARIKHRLAEPPDLPGIETDVDVVDALRRLPENQRVVLVLHYFADRRVDQIAAELGIAEGTVKSRLSRGRDALAVLLGDVEGSQGGRA
jgi:RNA polymerase sigma-70 factor, ECF subfamily